MSGVIAMFYRVTQDEDMKISFKCSVAHQLLLKCTRSWIVFEQHCPINDMNARSSVYTQGCFPLSLSDAKHNFPGLWWLIIWFFLCPQLIRMLFAFLPRVHCIAPRWSTFQGVSRNVDVIFVKNFANSIDVLSCSGIKSQHFNDHVYSSIIVEMKSEGYQFFWKVSFEIRAPLVKDPTHYSMQSFDCLVFWKQKWPVVRFKMTFSWFFVSTLNSDFGYIFWWSVMRWHFYEFQKQDAQALSRKVVSFLSIYFISMHNN